MIYDIRYVEREVITNTMAADYKPYVKIIKILQIQIRETGINYSILKWVDAPTVKEEA